ncbi:hypothetical protein H1C71_033175, partial [Ictidomys tridecemlineatus]
EPPEPSDQRGAAGRRSLGLRAAGKRCVRAWRLRGPAPDSPTLAPAHTARRDLEGAPSPPEPLPRPSVRGVHARPSCPQSPPFFARRRPEPDPLPFRRANLTPSSAKQASRRLPFKASRGDNLTLGAGPTTQGAAWATRALDGHQPRWPQRGQPGWEGENQAGCRGSGLRRAHFWRGAALAPLRRQC